MKKFNKHAVTLTAKKFIQYFDKNKATCNEYDARVLKHLLSGSIGDYDKLRLIDTVLSKYSNELDRLELVYDPLEEPFVTDVKSQITSNVIVFKIEGDIVEAHLPLLYDDKFNSLILELKKFGFQFRSDVIKPYWWRIVKDPTFFEMLKSSKVICDIGYYLDKSQQKSMLERIQESKDLEQNLLMLSAETDADIKIDGLAYDLYPFQKVSVEYSNHRDSIFITDQMGLGKCLSINSIVFTPLGKRKIGSIRVGDKVIGSNGQPTSVIGVYPQGIKDLYRVTFNDNSSVLCCKEHLWSVSSRNNHKYITLTTAQLMNSDGIVNIKGTGHNKNKFYEIKTYYKERNGNNKWHIPIINPIKFEQCDSLPISPYLLGLLIGDGSMFKSIRFEVHKDDFDELLSTIPNELYNETKPQKNNRIASFFRIRNKLKKLGLFGKYSHEKFIPKNYKYSSIDNRLSILQGLMDSDGTAGKYCTEYCTTSKQLANDVQELVETLGGIARLKTKIPTYIYKNEKRKGRKAYRLNIKLPSNMELFRLYRKRSQHNKSTKYPVKRYIKDISFEKRSEAVCISVDSVDQLYATDHCILTHNTVQAISILQHKDIFPALIIVPANLRENWQREFNSWLPDRTVHILKTTRKVRLADVYIISYGSVPTFCKGLQKVPFKSIVLDESHMIKNEKAKRTKAVLTLKTIPNKIAMTGTPILNEPYELMPQLDFLDVLEDHFGGRWNFVHKYAPPTSNGYWTEYGAANEEELQLELRKSCMIRREKEDVLSELPPKTRQIIFLPLSNYKMYYEVERDSVNWYKQKLEKNENLTKLQIEAMAAKKKMDRDPLAEKLVRVSACKQAATEYKMKAAIEWIDNALEQIDKLVVFTYHRDAIDQLMNVYHDQAVYLYGGMTNKVTSTIEKFKTDKNIKLFFGSILSTSTGIDGLQGVCNHAAFLELGWNPSIHEQGEDRLHRIGQLDNVNIYYLLGSGTIDEYIYDLIIEKGETIDKATNIDKIFDMIKNR